jgi:hypothetical protein
MFERKFHTMATTQEIITAVEEYNADTRWARIYYNTDNGYTWFENDLTCPKANHITYNNNPNIVVLFEKGAPEQNDGGVTSITADDVNAKAAAYQK